jgi:hypothetical protein
MQICIGNVLKCFKSVYRLCSRITVTEVVLRNLKTDHINLQNLMYARVVSWNFKTVYIQWHNMNFTSVFFWGGGNLKLITLVTWA